MLTHPSSIAAADDPSVAETDHPLLPCEHSLAA